jgi:hypothetical protein
MAEGEPAVSASSAPLAPFKDAVAERAKVAPGAVDLLFADLGIAEEKATRRAESLAIRRLMFSGEKQASGSANGGYTFEWTGLGPGHWGILSNGTNQIGKSTVLEVMLWALRGYPRGLKPEVRAWIAAVEMDFTVGPDQYRVSLTDIDNAPRGSLVMIGPGPARTLETFDGDEAFEAAMGDLMMKRFALQPIPNIRHESADGDPSQYMHSWMAYAASMFIEGSHPAILGDVTVGALWWRMLHLFVGLPYAGTHMALRNAVALERAARAAATPPAVGRGYADDIKRLEAELAREQRALQALGAGTVSLRELDALTIENATLARRAAELEGHIADAQRASAAVKVERDEARAVLRRLEEGAASRRVFAGLKPVCCPRCSAALPDSRTEEEEQSGRCAVCDRNSLGEDAQALSEALAEARERVEELVQYELAARSGVEKLTAELSEVQKQRLTATSRIRAIEAQATAIAKRRAHEDSILKLTGALEERRLIAAQVSAATSNGDHLAILTAAEAIAETRMKQASVELFADLEREVVAVAKRFGFRGLESIAIRGNGITVTVSGVASGYGRQTAGQRLRLRIALVVAMMRLAERSGFGHHPGVLFIDSPGSEELSDDDLLAMLQEIGKVATETTGLQIFVASARGDLLAPAFEADNLRCPGEGGTIF